MIHDELSIINIFCEIDNFCKMFIPIWNKHLLDLGRRKRIRKDCLSISEIMTILILF